VKRADVAVALDDEARGPVVLADDRAARPLDRNRREHPRRQYSSSTGEAGWHPVLAHGLYGCRDIAVGVAQKSGGVTPFPRRSKQRTSLIVDTVQQDGQKQAMVDVAQVEQRGPGL